MQTRNVFNLVANTPGVQSSGGTIGIMAGGRLGDVNATRDGVNVNDGRYENGAWSVVFTSADMVEEVKIVVAPVRCRNLARFRPGFDGHPSGTNASEAA